jgi:predicted nucleic acid-binding protein
LKLTSALLRTSIFVDTSAFFALADRTDRLHSSAVRFVETNERLLVTSNLKAWILFQRYSDKRFSFVDCASFALMKRLGIPAAFAFDEDFRRLGQWIVYPEG